jgi:hypothetical protein
MSCHIGKGIQHKAEPKKPLLLKLQEVGEAIIKCSKTASKSSRKIAESATEKENSATPGKSSKLLTTSPFAHCLYFLTLPSTVQPHQF